MKIISFYIFIISHGKESDVDTNTIKSAWKKINLYRFVKRICQVEVDPGKKIIVAEKQPKLLKGGACPASKSKNSSKTDVAFDSDRKFQEQIDKPLVKASHEETIDLNVQSQTPGPSKD